MTDTLYTLRVTRTVEDVVQVRASSREEAIEAAKRGDGYSLAGSSQVTDRWTSAEVVSEDS